MKSYNVVILILLILNLVDYDTTVRIINAGGSEANPIMNYVILATGVMWPILAIKMFFVGIIWWGFGLLVEATAYTVSILSMVTMIYTGVVARSVRFCLEYGLF